MSLFRAGFVATLLLAVYPAAADQTADGTRAAGHRPMPPQLAMMRCFAISEKVIGVDRICYYRCAGITVTSIAVRADELCPIFIDK
jgi:hypothetical protein